MLGAMPRFIACPSCEQHVKAAEPSCPHCGAALRDGTGKILRTATAAVLGLVATAGACDDTISEPVAEYGPAPSVNAAATTGTTGGGGAGASDGGGGFGGYPVAEYGPAPTVGGGGTNPGGAGGTGGSGGAGGN